MSIPLKVDTLMLERARNAAQNATTVDELRRAQSILLPALLGATLAQSASALGVGHATVSRLRAAFQKKPDTSDKIPTFGWGGRRNAWMTLDEERAFLEPWIKRAIAGSLLVVSPLRAALAERVGQPVKASLIYRMLARHGWRKVAPDTRHPKSNPAAQADWKKNSRKHWRP
jgi:transposase